MSKAIQTADLDWQCVDGIEIPFSKKFADVYFSRDNGLLESRHVFLQGNDLPIRLANLHDFEYFSIGETGFGTGLNILALWQLWQQVRPANQSHLHAVSIEKFPLNKNDLIRALNVWPELKPLADQLIQHYPILIAGCHRLNFPNERFSLDLWLGDVHDVLPSMHKTKAINAWFLDGFAPSCNPDIWDESTLKELIRLSDIGTTFTSFSVAGVLKQGFQQQGISISRPKGFGHKREMLKAIWELPSRLNQDLVSASENPTYSSKKASSHSRTQYKQHKIAVIGAGIAGLSCAWAFAQRGHQVTIYDQTAPLAGASGNPLALLNPKLSSAAQSAEHLVTATWQYALQHYQQFDGFRALHVNQLAQKDAEDFLSLAQQYSDEVFTKQDANALALKTQFASLQLKPAAAIYPHQLQASILKHPLIHFQHAQVDSIQKQEHGQLILLNQGHVLDEFDHVMVCAAMNSPKFIDHYPRLKPNRGQVSWVNNQKQPLQTNQAYSYTGYCMQLDPQHLIMGASFYPHRDDHDVLAEDHVHNYDLIHSAFPEYAETLAPIAQWQGRASVRTQSPDYFPLLGKMQEDTEIYTLSALGSKGFLYAPLCSEILAALVLGEVCPIPQNLLQKLSLRRFQKKVKPKKPYFNGVIVKP
ncbi:FAD-dependent 5-carboxymethylaminomethyl-2-thiouridine(34) oxidoreductase MnmC [Acinetobacter sp. ANC 4648]|uniref:FAD-dependent 5-carboxymethylaminomethyl-2-thiouridine(34) oxidoreductase MnmC n=1 Tax=Acinetobacter sp. ANC 4648 TaxID=1977875 RepID=UPI000A33C95C|nr:FAD-dependent 5-carboxymethylaminomethyl-2-thiouridine(34) oxidoreductase MnmC [Acinetobacter sp. ANC 4648]OTG84048.1 FAD-dependent cmnm(5)s(2)U34 oxidoreductase [Acinetobacter sp. ANC 4648]